MCLEIYGIVRAYFLSAPGLAWQAALARIKVKLYLLTEIDMLLMVENSIRGGICRAIHRYVKAKNKYMTGYNKYRQCSHLKYWDINNLYDWECHKSCLQALLNVLKIDLYLVKFL